MDDFAEARQLLLEWKGNNYHFESGVLGSVGETIRNYGETALIITNGSNWIQGPFDVLIKSLKNCRVSYKVILGAKPNAPLDDLYRIALQVALHKPESILAFGGGSTIDASKAANVLATYSSEDVAHILGSQWAEAGTIDPFFGTGLITKVRNASGKDLIPLVAVQTSASSASHLTKYSNITDSLKRQKKLIVDNTIIPKVAFFDYEITKSAPEDLTVDGGLDGIAHCWEVFMGASGKDYYQKVEHIVSSSLRLIINNLPLIRKEPNNIKARTALGLGTDLGGYAIMLGGTNGPHLGSFSLVDVLTHGRACALLGPYYTVFFAKAIQEQLQAIAQIFRDAGYLKKDFSSLDIRGLAEAVATAMFRFNTALGVPTNLQNAGVSEEHLNKMLAAAKDPQLQMKLLNMPIPLDVEKGDVDTYMRQLLTVAFKGNLHNIPFI